MAASARRFDLSPAWFCWVGTAPALELIEAPIVEVHLSNVDEREEWRRKSVISDLAAHRIIGKGPDGYKEAIEWLTEHA